MERANNYFIFEIYKKMSNKTTPSMVGNSKVMIIPGQCV